MLEPRINGENQFCTGQKYDIWGGRKTCDCVDFKPRGGKMSYDFVDFSAEVIPRISILVDLPILPPSWVAKRRTDFGALSTRMRIYSIKTRQIPKEPQKQEQGSHGAIAETIKD